MERMKQIIRRLLDIIGKPVMRILPGQLAFFLVLSIIPIITLIGYIASLFSISIESLISFMNQALPAEVTEILLPFISGQGLDANVLIFLLFCCYFCCKSNTFL